MCRCSVFFFFQAEDGIRDYKVTGVQTCALPIYLRRSGAPGQAARLTSGTRHPGAGRGAGAPQQVKEGLPVTVPTMLVLLIAQGAAPGAPDNQWPMPAKDYAATRFSGLAQISAANVPRLRAVWSFSTGVLAGHEGQPLVVNKTMYVVTPYPNVLYAFDLTQDGYPLKWKYRPNVDAAAMGIACCDVVNRGAFFADGKIVYNLLDGHTVAIDAATGREVWSTPVADVRQGESTPMAPLVVRDRVIVGTAGGEFGVRGWEIGRASCRERV